jgi:hypothetical protein
MSPATRAAGIQPGATVRLRPGLRDKAYSAKSGTVLEIVNDRVRVKIGALEYVVERSEVQTS